MNKNEASNIKAILAERGSNYGSFDGHAVITQGIKLVMTRDWESLQSLLDSLRKYDPTPHKIASNASQQEALAMIAHKIGRIINGNPYYADSWIDIIGYAQLIVDELEADEGKVTTIDQGNDVDTLIYTGSLATGAPPLECLWKLPEEYWIGRPVIWHRTSGDKLTLVLGAGNEPKSIRIGYISVSGVTDGTIVPMDTIVPLECISVPTDDAVSQDSLDTLYDIGDKFGVKVKLATSSSQPLEDYSIKECDCPKCVDNSVVTAMVYKEGKAIIGFIRDKEWSARMHSTLEELHDQLDKFTLNGVRNMLAGKGLATNATDPSQFDRARLIHVAHQLVEYCGSEEALETYLKYTKGKYPGSQQELIDTILELTLLADAFKSDSIDVFFNELMERAKKQNK